MIVEWILCYNGKNQPVCRHDWLINKGKGNRNGQFNTDYGYMQGV